MGSGEDRDGVPLTHLDEPLFDGSGATKRDLIDYLDAVCDSILPGLEQRPLSVIRVRLGRRRSCRRTSRSTRRTDSDGSGPGEASKREISYALCNDRRTLLWFANQRAVEYPNAERVDAPHWQTHLVLDLDPPEGRTSPRWWRPRTWYVRRWSMTGSMER